MYHRLIALAALILGAIGIVAPAHADGWSAWKTFKSHKGVEVEWRTYSSPNNDTMADWRVTNNSDQSLFRLSLGWRHYTCSNGSEYDAINVILGEVEVKPGASVTLAGGGGANWIDADQFDRDTCHSIVDAHFDSKAAILEFALGGPNEPVKPWTEHAFAGFVDEYGCWDARGCVTGDAEWGIEPGWEEEYFLTTHKNTCDRRVIVLMCHEISMEDGFLNMNYMEEFAGSNCATVGLFPGAIVQHVTRFHFEPTGEYNWEYTGSANPSEDPTVVDGVEWWDKEIDLYCAVQYGLIGGL